MKKIYVITEKALSKIDLLTRIYNRGVDTMSIDYIHTSDKVGLYLTNICCRSINLYIYSSTITSNYIITYMKMPSLNKISGFNISVKFKML